MEAFRQDPSIYCKNFQKWHKKIDMIGSFANSANASVKVMKTLQ